jgi:hypothetical protein
VNGKFRLKRLMKLEFTVVFYSLAAVLIAVFALHNKQDVFSWFKAFFPVSLENYWFITIYMVICLLSPMFNKLINRLDKPHFTAVTVIMFTLVCILPAITFNHRLTILNGNFLIGIYGYFIGAYLRKYPIKFLDNIVTSATVFIITYIALGLVSVYGYKYAEVSAVANMRDIFLAHESILMILCSASAMMLFKNIKIGSVRVINFVTQTILGVYIIHDSPQLKLYMWHNILHTSDVSDNRFFIFYALKIILTVFIGCSIIELIRIYAIEKNLFKLKIFDKTCEKIDNFMNEI